jgi:hypothetical protein
MPRCAGSSTGWAASRCTPARRGCWSCLQVCNISYMMRGSAWRNKHIGRWQKTHRLCVRAGHFVRRLPFLFFSSQVSTADWVALREEKKRCHGNKLARWTIEYSNLQ